MENDEVKQLIEGSLANSQVAVEGDGSHFDATIICPDFEGKNTLARQRMVFAAVGDAITSGRLHNLNIKALTPAEAG